MGKVRFQELVSLTMVVMVVGVLAENARPFPNSFR